MMRQERLAFLSLLMIEADLLRQINFEDLIIENREQVVTTKQLIENREQVRRSNFN